MSTYYMQACNCTGMFGQFPCPIHDPLPQNNFSTSSDKLIIVRSDYGNETLDYYRPSAEELFPGYECQYLMDYVVDETLDKEWINVTLSHASLSGMDVHWMRTPYLTGSQVAKLGWEDEGGGTSFHKEGGLHLFRTKVIFENKVKSCPLLISRANQSLYMGECKSVNEFKTILKWLRV